MCFTVCVRSCWVSVSFPWLKFSYSLKQHVKLNFSVQWIHEVKIERSGRGRCGGKTRETSTITCAHIEFQTNNEVNKNYICNEKNEDLLSYLNLKPEWASLDQYYKSKQKLFAQVYVFKLDITRRKQFWLIRGHATCIGEPINENEVLPPFWLSHTLRQNIPTKYALTNNCIYK